MNESLMEQVPPGPDAARVGATATERRKSSMFDPNLDGFKDLYFRARFRQLIDAVEAMDPNRLSLNAYFRIQLMKISALFEMHQVAEAHTLIRQLDSVSSAELESPEFLHFLARLKYLDGDFDGALELWQELLSMQGARNFRFKGLLGVANVLFSQKRYDSMPALLADLGAYHGDMECDESLSFMILQANFYWSSGRGMEKAKQIFHSVMSESVMVGWYYFFARAVYGLACVAQAQDNLTTLKTHLETLQAILKPSDNLLLKHLVNKRFHQAGHVCTVDLEVDYDTKRIRVGEKWHDFHKTPLLFHFLTMLYGSNTFVSKQTIAKGLWPEEAYRPRLHNPRIFNIAKRVREEIEVYESQPIILLSGRFGYKLALRDTQSKVRQT